MRSESGRTDPIDGRQRAARLAQGRARRGQGRARRGRRRGRRRRPTTAGRCCTGSPRRSSRAPRSSAGASKDVTRRARRGRRPARPLRGLDGQARGGDGRHQPGRRAVPVASPRRSRPASSPCSRRTRRTLLGLVREVAPALAAGNTVVAIVSRRSPLRALDLGEVAGVSDVPGGVLNLLCGRLDELLDAAVRPSRRQRDRRRHRRRRRWRRRSTARRRDGQARVAPGAATRRLADAAGGAMELKTAWHPVGT